MATVEAKVFSHHLKNDGTYNVKIRVFHKQERKFIETEHYVSAKKVKKDPKSKTDLIIADQFVRRLLNRTLDDYREKISGLGEKLELFTCGELRDYLEGADKEIDFIAFCTEYIQGLRDLGKSKTAANFNTIKNSLTDFFRRPKVGISEIDVDLLVDWEIFLRTERTMVRLNQFQKEVITTQSPCTDASVHNYMRDLRGLFNHARKKYNKKKLGLIRIEHYPFDEYEIIRTPITKKRNCKIGTLNRIRFSRAKKDSRAAMARDLFMLSYYMCGINAADLFQIDNSNIVKGRLEYNRSKTRDKRKDNAFISIKIVNEAKPLLDKYLGKLQLRYATIGELNKALSHGLRDLCVKNNLVGVTYYWARHSVGTVARNKCRMSTDDIGLALNHVDQGKKTTDIYIEKDWRIVDELQGKVIKLLGRWTRKNQRWASEVRKRLSLTSAYSPNS
ncbi:site-specific integrase [Pedobacter sp. GR22-6]|uniref:site-specific integrase n=1 Tax=Pedobacter sp. GR22-6 TaxID=3127957 RepID=UPI00307E4458